MNEVFYQIALTKIPNVGAVLAKTLFSYCGSAEAVFAASKKELMKIPSIGTVIAQDIIDKKSFSFAEKELTYLTKNQVRALFYTDDAYPQMLKNYHDCPALLYYKGNADLNAERVLSVVGTRKPTHHGKAICEEIVNNMKGYKPLIVSGLAFGIDAAAHRAALEAGLPTVGVLGNGLSKIYPAQHKALTEEMLENGGLLTEFCSDTGPDREHFPMRNRIVAAWCHALVIIETALRGGAMITAELGNGYNKDVFAVPGRPKDTFSQGCNFLIKNNKAILVESAEDIAQTMLWEQTAQTQVRQKQLFVELQEDEQRVVNILQTAETMSIDKLTYAMQLNSSNMSGLLLEMEFKGIIKSLPGKLYALNG